MAAPVILGLSALGTLLTRFLEWMFKTFAERVAGRLAASLIWIGLYIALLVGLAATFSLILGGITATLPPDLAQGMGMIKPPNLEACVAAIYSSKVAMWVFQQKKQLIDWEQQRPST